MVNNRSTDTFLEPIYLNEKMVLNCAAYLFKGYSLETEEREKSQADHTTSFKAGLTFLEKLISFGGETQTKRAEATENKSARRYTVGGLHMSLVDELHGQDMLRAIDPARLADDTDDISTYVEMSATLRPNDFYALIDTLRISSPIVGEVLKSFVRPLRERSLAEGRAQSRDMRTVQTSGGSAGNHQQRRSSASPPPASPIDPKPMDIYQLVLNDTDKYVAAIMSVLEQLESDYRRSKQIEMVMWSTGGESRPFGVVDLDLVDYEPEELRAKLSGGTYHVIGKATRVVKQRESINLLQKSALFSALSLINRVIELQGQTESLDQYRSALLTVRPIVERFGLLEIHGPAIRISAMSICI